MFTTVTATLYNVSATKRHR